MRWQWLVRIGAYTAVVSLMTCDDGTSGRVVEPVLKGAWVSESDTLCESYLFDGVRFRRYLYYPNGDTVGIRRGTFEEDTTRTPWWIDLTITYDSSALGISMQGLLRGIFAVNGDTLRIACPKTFGEPQRPPDFSGAYEWYTVSVLRRQR